LLTVLIPSMSYTQEYILPLWQDMVPNYRQTDEKEIRNAGDILGISKVQNPEIAVYLPGNLFHTAIYACRLKGCPSG